MREATSDVINKLFNLVLQPENDDKMDVNAEMESENFFVLDKTADADLKAQVEVNAFGVPLAIIYSMFARTTTLMKASPAQAKDGEPRPVSAMTSSIVNTLPWT